MTTTTAASRVESYGAGVGRWIRGSGVALLACSMVACGYKSQYAPPDGYRARPMYVGNEVVALVPPELPKCMSELKGPLPAPPDGVSPPPVMTVDDRGNWSGVGNVHVVVVGPLPPHWLWFPHPVVPPGPHNALFAGMSSGTGGGGGGGGGGGKEGEAMAVLIAALAALALAASAGVAIGLAADPVESQGVGSTIDEVNQYNDAARHKIARCLKEAQSLPGPKAGESTPRPQEGW